MENETCLQFDALQTLARCSDAVTADCACSVHDLVGWTSLPVSFPEAQLGVVGTLIRDNYTEAAFDEYHPQGTTFWSAEAPIAPRHFPANRCTVSTCKICQRAYLRYVEGGGYFVDPRIRRLSANVLVDAPLPE